MSIFQCIVRCLFRRPKPRYSYTFMAKAHYSGQTNFFPVYGNICVNPTTNTPSEDFIQYTVHSFTLTFDSNVINGNSGNLRFHQHSPGEYHNEGYSLTSNDGTFHVGYDDAAQVNSMIFPTPPDFIDYANGGSGAYNDKLFSLNTVLLVKQDCKICP